ncbi:MAG TPA: gamma carbonic anhydrase family protein, partial [Haliangiales bacterium]|nr:gamma carbonic anhydrase family protein [Haliangiales bacterium]
PACTSRGGAPMSIIRSYRGKHPSVGDGAYVADNAVLVGDVIVGARSSIWFGTVLRGDVYHIRVGEETSIQDNSVVHVTHGRNATLVGSRVTVGHSVTLHGCVVRDRCIIGMGSIILDEAEIGERCIIGAGAVVTPGTKIPPGTLAVGAPARPKRELDADELRWIEASADHYVELARSYLGVG